MLPYGVVQLHKANQGAIIAGDESFWDLYQAYLQNGQYVMFKEESPFETIVSVEGLNYSGSSAVVDLLREYENVTTVGLDDASASIAKHTKLNYEFTMVVGAGGLFDIERHIGTYDAGYNFEVLMRFMEETSKSGLFWQLPEVQPYYFEFFRQICDTNFDPHKDDPSLPQWFPSTAIMLKEMTVQEYRKLCNYFLNTLFAIIKEDYISNEYLVLDHLFSEHTWNVKRAYEYVPNLKSIIVIRDFRDIYAFGNIHKKYGSIPYRNVEGFIRFYKAATRFLNAKGTDDYIVVWLEDLVYNYDETKVSIEQYLGLESKWHVQPLTCLIPENSKKNLGLWKQHPEWNAAFDKIAKELPDFCYKKEI